MQNRISIPSTDCGYFWAGSTFGGRGGSLFMSTNKRTPTHNSWIALKKRCLDPCNNRYYVYGARGITVCDRWLKFENFLEDMGERPPGTTIDRKDNNLGYYKENCRWATRVEQASNKSTNHFITINGVTKTVSEWTRHFGLNPKTVWSRLQYGWPDDERLFDSKLNEKPMALLTEAQVLEIRAMYRYREFGFTRIGRKFGVCASCIQAVIERRTWKNI